MTDLETEGESIFSLNVATETHNNTSEERGEKDASEYLHFENHENLIACASSESIEDFLSVGTFDADKKKHEQKSFQCMCCSLSFHEEELLLKHEEVHFEVEEVNECPDCCLIFATKSELSKHACKRHKKRFMRRHKCKECGRSFLQKSSLRAHLTIHTGEKPFNCEFCLLSFRLNSSLQRHQLKEHIGVKPYVCGQCSKSFGHKSDLMHHVRSVHAAERLFVCQICDEKFTSNVVLMRHVNIHFELKLNVCKVCSAKFSHSGSLHNHMRVHSAERSFLCNDCGKSYKFKAHLKNHSCFSKPKLRKKQIPESRRSKRIEIRCS